MIRISLLVSACVVVGSVLLPPSVADNGSSLSEPRVTLPGFDVNADVPSTEGRVDFPRFPSISPDGKQVVFTWRGDLWKVGVEGGHARRLTTHRGNDLRSVWTPDGRFIVFDSARTGYRNIHLMEADGTAVRAVTEIDQTCSLAGVGKDADGRLVATFSSGLEGDNYRSPRPFMCSLEGGDLLRVHDAFGSFPRISPDGTRVAFTRGGSRWARRHYRGPDNRDVWLYNRDDGSFRQLTRWAGNDGKAVWAGDQKLVFLSDREFNRFNLYELNLDGGGRNIRRLTAFTDADVQDLDVSYDGTTAVLMAWDKLYTLDLTNKRAEPKPLTITANEDENDNFELHSINRDVSEAALSPDGKVMAYTAYGEVYVRNLEDKSATRRVTFSHARDRDIAWSPDGLKLYFVSDREGSDSIYAATVALTRGEVKEEFEKATKPKKEEEEADDEEEASEEDEAEAKEDPASEPDPAEPAADPGADPAVEPGGDPGTEPKAEPGGDPDPDKPAKDPEEDGDDGDGDKKKGKKDKKEELPKELQPDRWHDALKFNIEPVVVTPDNDRSPTPSPDGTMLGFRRSRGNLMILDLETKEERLLVPGWDGGIAARWSPDSKLVAYAQNDMNFNSDIWIVLADGSKPAINITQHPDNDVNPSWSADGKILCFTSERVDEEYDVWRVYLDKDLEALTPKELDKYYEDAAKAAKKRKPLEVKNPKADEDDDGDDEGADAGDDASEDDGKDAKPDEKGAEGEDEKDAKEKNKDAGKDDGDDEEDADEADEVEECPLEKLDLEDAYLRLQRITRDDGNEGSALITPGGDRIIFSARHPSSGLYSVKWDGSDRKRISGFASVQGISLTGDKLVLVSGSRAATIKPTGGKMEYYDISDRIRIDLQKQASQKFLEMARVLGENFYHPTLKGLDWPTLTRKYHKLARQTRTGDEFNHVGMQLMGELNGSHLGVYARDPGSPNQQSMGRLGTTHRRVDGGFEVLSIVPESPASKGEMALELGDIITAVDLRPFEATDTLASRLAGRVNEETIISVQRKREDGEILDLDLLITPTSAGAIRRLQYDAWRHRNADMVDEWSNGRLGYIHIEGMSQPSLDVFERDLYAACHGKDGLLIDVRNNGGGWTADRLLSSIMVQQHAYTIPRGADPSDVGHYPQDRLFIQRYTLPINMLCNEKSFSNAEIISHAFKTLGRGTLVGQQTYGGVISTGGTSLIDGTFFRLPFRGWYVVGGMDMENNGAMPDIVVPQTPEAESREDDEQLRAAVNDLLDRIG
jgi:tricorn protease